MSIERVDAGAVAGEWERLRHDAAALVYEMGGGVRGLRSEGQYDDDDALLRWARRYRDRVEEIAYRAVGS